MDPANTQMIIVLVVVAIVVGTAGIILMRKLPSQRQVLEEWSRDNALTIDVAERSTNCLGPFGRLWCRSTNCQAVFRITVRDAQGHIQKGYARVGGFFGLGHDVKVEWDEDPQSDVTPPDAGDMA